MKKIDLHIHTITTVSDNPVEFSLDKLKEYVRCMEIDCIAITNHNTFDKEQFEIISSSLDITVFPGIEIDLEGGHILLISDNKDHEEFGEKCAQVKAEILSNTDYISLEKFCLIFTDLSKYLLIPHYDKKPVIKQEVINKLKHHISAGEVTSVRKFKACLKEVDKLVPVIFSDMRFHESLNSFPVRQTFIDIEELTFNGIKSCLFDKNKVFLSREDGNKLFQVTDDGLKISTGLNIIFGERSTGKTYTLERICNSFENVKFIEQFSLLQNDEAKFEGLMSIRHSNVSETFLKEFKDVIGDISSVDLKQNEIDIEKYISTLLRFASENDKSDTYSKAALFAESLFTEVRQESLKKLIESTILLIENVAYKELIDRHISITNLKNLVVELIKTYVETEELNLKKKWVNELVSNVQQELRFRTNCTHPEDIDFYKILLDNKKAEKFSQITRDIKNEREIDRKEIRGFKVVAYVRQFTGATQLKNKSKRKLSFMDTYSKYDNPYEYLQSLKGIELEATEYYRYFVDIEYKTLNKHGYPVSGGERSEFNLLHEISDALKHDLLLLDEPESSFDNIFLKNEVNELIKDIAKEIPVIVVTHNSTVGASIKPDYILYTDKKLENGSVKYRVYFGYPSSKELKSPTGDTILNFDAMLNCLEAGIDAYTDRRTKSYEILKN
ncbi:MAG: histidinol-phosphatase [Cytophagales bacterium]|nr:histidinol-phosphatase [Cytophagales bacterium]